VVEETAADTDMLDLTKTSFEDYCKQLPGSPVDVLPLGFEKLGNELGMGRMEEFIEWCKKTGFRIDENKKQVYVDKSLLPWEESIGVKEEEGKQPPIMVVAPAANQQEEQQEVKTISQRILEHFDKHPESQNMEEIADALSLETDSGLKMALRRLVEKGELQNPKRGLYCRKEKIMETEAEKPEAEKQPPLTEVAPATNQQEEQIEEKSIPQRILEHFDKHPQKQGREDISKALNIAVEDFEVQLSRLVKKGEIANPERGVYCNINYKE